MSKTFRVDGETTVTWTTLVDAEDEDEAEELAIEAYLNGTVDILDEDDIRVDSCQEEAG